MEWHNANNPPKIKLNKDNMFQKISESVLVTDGKGWFDVAVYRVYDDSEFHIESLSDNNLYPPVWIETGRDSYHVTEYVKFWSYITFDPTL